MRKRSHTNSKMTKHQHEMRPSKISISESGRVNVLARVKDPFGIGLNKLRTKLVIPEVRKPRSKQDPEVLKAQQKAFIPA